MNHEEYKITGEFSLFYDSEKVIPLLDELGMFGQKIKQLIWNHAYEHTITDFKTCGKNNEYKFFIIKDKSIKVSYRDYQTHWIVYSITPV